METGAPVKKRLSAAAASRMTCKTNQVTEVTVQPGKNPGDHQHRPAEGQGDPCEDQVSRLPR